MAICFVCLSTFSTTTTTNLGDCSHLSIVTNQLIPWLFFYSVFSVALFAISVLVGFYSHGALKAVCIVPALIAAFYIYIWVCVLHLFKLEKESKSLIIKKLNSIALEPLVEIARKSMKEKESV